MEYILLSIYSFITSITSMHIYIYIECGCGYGAGQRILYYNIFLYQVKRMSRGNVFKLSGNMALGGGSDYGNNDIEEIKNSLKLLKAKKNQKTSGEEPMGYGYGGNQLPPKNMGAQKADYNYEALSKNHLPGSQKDTGGYDYGKKNYTNTNQYSDPKSYSQNQNRRQVDPYEYGNKPPSNPYPQQSNSRNNRNVQPQQQEAYDQYPSYSGKNLGSKSSTAQTKTSEHNSYSKQSQPPARQQPKQYKQEQEYYNDKEQRSIKEVNRENRIDIVEYDPSELRPCRVCGRKFNPDSIGKHEANCKQVFQKKRKEFNTQEQRIVDNQQKKLMKKGEQVEQKLRQQEKNQKIPKWKADSLALRAGLKENRNEPLDPRQAAMLKQAQNDAGVKCPHCGRVFNDTAGPRHVKFCEEQSKKNMMKKKK